MMGILKRVTKAIFNEVTKPKSFAKGEEFEQYLRDYIFPERAYHLEHRSHDYSTNRTDYVADSLDPDFVFVSVKGEKMFFVEAKYRSDFYQDAVEWCKPYQLKRYKEANKELPVFIALGVGGTPDMPDYLYIFPVKHTKYPKLFRSVLRKSEVELDKPVKIEKLWKLL
jgi:hypothetical protein